MYYTLFNVYLNVECLLQILERLANMADVYVVVISGRELQDLHRKVGVDGLTYAACHGLHVMHADGHTYK